MKKFLITLLITGLVFGTQVYAQQGNGKGLPKPPVPGQTPPKPKHVPGQPPKPNVVKPNKPVPPPVPPSDQGKGQDKAKENQGKGNAYGKDKEGLEGKEFGQHRAAEAKSKHEAVTNSNQAIDNASKTNEDTHAKIKEAKNKLEKNKKEKKISDAEYNKKKKELDDLETQVNELDKKNAELKGKLSKENEVKQK